VDVEQLKRAASADWGKGDYSGLSAILRPAAQALCDACAVSAGQEVLDVAAGDGNFALACAFEGASVVASDLSPGMVERGKARSEAEGYDVEWVEADAEDLPFDNDRFECVGSVFGAVMAPRPEVVAGELFRVVRPGNTVGLVAWADGATHQPWGNEDVVRERFGPYANTIEIERRSLPSPPDAEYLVVMARKRG
jgi:SAM-dependent methyltransferase